MEIWTVIKDLLISGAAITGAVVAVKGLGTWQRQLKGQTEYELSRRILVSLFKYRDAVNSVRNPTMWGHEMPSPSAEEAKGMSYETINHDGTSKAYQDRWDKVNEQRASLYADILEAEAIWGPELQGLFEVIFKLENELFIKIRHYLQLINPETPQSTKEALANIDSKGRDIMYDMSGDEPDAFKQDLLNAMRPIETYLKLKLKNENV